MLGRRSFIWQFACSAIMPRFAQLPANSPSKLVIGLGPLGARVQRQLQNQSDTLFWVWSTSSFPAEYEGRADVRLPQVHRYQNPQADLLHLKLHCAVRERVRHLNASVSQAAIVGSMSELTTLVFLPFLWRDLIQRAISTRLIIMAPGAGASLEAKRRAASTFRTLDLIEPFHGYVVLDDAQALCTGGSVELQLVEWVRDSFNETRVVTYADPLSIYFNRKAQGWRTRALRPEQEPTLL